jgi:hypothetical protein
MHRFTFVQEGKIMGWIHTCRPVVLGVAAVVGMILLFARGPLGAQEKVSSTGSAPRPTADKPDLPQAVKAPQASSAGQPVAPSVEQAMLAEIEVAQIMSARRRFTFKIDPKTPLADLLPVAPKGRPASAPVLADDLTQVPEIYFQESLARGLPQESLKRTAHTIAKINHLNQKKTDAFMEALVESRRDLSGLPFAMGDSCRMKQERSRHFQQALNTIRQAMGPHALTMFAPPPPLPPPTEPSPSATVVQPASSFPPTAGVFTPPPPPAPQSGGQAQPPKAQPQPKPPQKSAPREAVRLDERAPAPPPIRTTVLGRGGVVAFTGTGDNGNRDTAEQVWQRYRAACLNEDVANAKYEPPHREHVTLARIAALMQVLAPESAGLRKGLVAYLATVSHPEATRALAKLAIFSKERGVREAACDALKVRRERDYTEILLNGLYYPWPAVAKHAAEAIVKLERKDLIPQLVSVLEEPDPRLPVTKNVKDQPTSVVRELVRVNHHRNCLMCHAPGNNGNAGNANVFTEVIAMTDGSVRKTLGTRVAAANSTSPDVLTAQVPVPDEPLPTPSQGYDNSQPDLLVRIDVTYLRQDFSERQSVADAHPWPEMQRFDFLVRTRTVTEDEAQTYRAKLTNREPGSVTPYQRSALAALRDLTGRDTEPTAQAWKRLLNLAERQGSDAVP